MNRDEVFHQLGLVFDCSPGVAVRIHEHLGVGVDGDEGLDVSMALHKVHNGLDLRFRVSPGSTVGLGARVATSTRSYKEQNLLCLKFVPK